ncbi:endonuclease domain-containing protein [Demequina sp.]|uniref:endonuclease domain-containing protein n=1 Tax=Demequina sp. TaxID=2050685 RepID=UPI003D0F6104
MSTGAANELAEALSRDVRAWRGEDLAHLWSAAALRSALRAGSVAKILTGVYASALHADSFITRAHAAQLWCGQPSVVIGAGAASVWGLCDTPDTVVLGTTYFTQRACPEWLAFRRFGAAVPSVPWHSLAVATPAWAAVTAYERATVRDRDQFLYRAGQSRHTNAAELLAAADSIGRLRGRDHLKVVLSAIARGSESHLETLALRTVFNTSFFADFLPQHWVRTAGGPFRLDTYHAPSKTAVELDGAGDHSKPEQRQYDINRDVYVAREGILTLRFSKRDIEERARECRESIKAVVNVRSH